MLACAAGAFDCLALVKPQFEVGREHVGKGGVVRDADDAPPGAGGRRAAARATLGAVGARLRSAPGCPGPKGNLRDASCGWPRPAARGRSPTSRPRRGRSSRERPSAIATRVHPPPPGRDLGRPSAALIALARDAGRRAALRRRGDREARASSPRTGVVLDAPIERDVDICCRARRRRHDPHRAAHATPARACRCSRSTTARSGFWPRSTATTSTAASGARSRATSRCSRCPAIVRSRARRASGWRSTTSRSTASRASGSPSSPTRSATTRSAACAATGSWCPRRPGSTGYNLANGGPVMAWGVEGFVVSFIAPHSLTARALVVAPQRRAHRPQPLARGAGRRHHRRAAGVRAGPRASSVEARLRRRPGRARPGRRARRSTSRLREKFGRLASLVGMVRCSAAMHRSGLRSSVGRVRRGALVDRDPCSTSCASRTCC